MVKVFLILDFFSSGLKGVRRLITGMKDNLALDEADNDRFEQAAATVYYRMDALEQK